MVGVGVTQVGGALDGVGLGSGDCDGVTEGASLPRKHVAAAQASNPTIIMTAVITIILPHVHSPLGAGCALGV